MVPNRTDGGELLELESLELLELQLADLLMLQPAPMSCQHQTDNHRSNPHVHPTSSSGSTVVEWT